MIRPRMLDAVVGLPAYLWGRVRRVRVATLVVVVITVAVGATAFTLLRDGRGGGGGRDGSVVTASDGRAVAPRDPPRSYRLVYQVESRAAGELVVSTEEIWARRPFDGRLEERPGAPPGEEDEVSVTVTRFGAHGALPFQAEPVALRVGPNPPIADLHPLAALEAGVEAGMVERRERRRVTAIERGCQVYRLGGPIGGGVLTPTGETEGEYADVCVDSRGFVLEEVWFVDGGERILQRRLAAEIEEEPTLPARLFDGPDADPPPVDQGGGSIRRVDPSSRPPADVFFELPEPPRGFRHHGRYAVVPPQAEAFGDPAKRDQRVASVVDVWVRGGEFIAVDQGGTLGGAAPFEAHPHAIEVDGGEVGPSELVLGLRTSEVRTVRESGRYVRVYGPVAPDRLLTLTRRLAPRPGGDLVYLDASTSSDGP